MQVLGERVVDPIFRMRAANRKVYQLHLARNCELQTPSTCVTNDPGNRRQARTGDRRTTESTGRPSIATWPVLHAIGPKSSVLMMRGDYT